MFLHPLENEWVRTCQAAYIAPEDLLEELLKASCGTTEVDVEWRARRLAWNGRVQGGLVSMVVPCCTNLCGCTHVLCHLWMTASSVARCGYERCPQLVRVKPKVIQSHAQDKATRQFKSVFQKVLRGAKRGAAILVDEVQFAPMGETCGKMEAANLEQTCATQ